MFWWSLLTDNEDGAMPDNTDSMGAMPEEIDKDAISDKRVINPRYEGATPDMVGRALLRPQREKIKEDGDKTEPAAA